jgi:predicted NBD/HSP70 family sugar kinase
MSSPYTDRSDRTEPDVVALEATEPATAPPGALQLRPRGSNQVGLRQYNERVLLQAIRLHGELPKADLARLTHLSTQTVSLIVNRLLEDGLLIKREPVRGRIGQPSVPIALNPDGAFSVGVKIGRRSMDVLLVDFTGQVRERASLSYEFPDPLTLFDALAQRVAQVSSPLGALQDRITGMGVAAPLSLGGWQSLLGVPDEQARRWDEIDLAARLRELTTLPVHLVKDTAAACVAELVAGRGRSLRSYLYLFMDTFVGGGLVIDSHLFGGDRGNAGAVGSMPLLGGAGIGGVGGAPAQVLSTAALLTLERRYAAAGLPVDAAADARALEPPWSPHTREWIKGAAQAMALAITNCACLLDIGDVIVDGVFSRDLQSRLIAEIENALDTHSWEGVIRPAVLSGTIGADARALGGALLPLYATFAPDPEVFLKGAPGSSRIAA